jgi:hypothetical protein
MWHWFSRGIGGRNALDYLIKVQDYSFIDAVEAITGRAAAMPSVSHAQQAKPEHRLLMPELNDNTAKAEQYLQRRGIDREIIDYCVITVCCMRRRLTTTLCLPVMTKPGRCAMPPCEEPSETSRRGHGQR